MQTELELAFGDGRYLFRLPIKQIVALEKKAGPIDAVKQRLIFGGYSILDVLEVIRHGLIGGGRGIVNGEEKAVSDLLATHLVETYAEGTPLADTAATARSVISALFVGYDPAADAQKKSAPKKPRHPKRSIGGLSSTTAAPSG